MAGSTASDPAFRCATVAPGSVPRVWRRIRAAALASAMVTFGGCSHTERYGDARYVRTSDRIFITADALLLPWFALDRPGRHRFRVRGLPAPVFPRWLDCRAPSPLVPDASLGQAPVVRVVIRDPEGNTWAERRLVRWESAVAQLHLPAETWERAAGRGDFDVEVIVERGAAQSGLKGRLRGQAF